MPMKFQRPQGAYAGREGLSNRAKYQDDAGASPRRAISSAKMDGDINYLVDAVNETWDAMVAESFTSALPDQAGNAGKVVATNGTTASWQQVSGQHMQAKSVPLDRLADIGQNKLVGAADNGAVTPVTLGSGLALNGGVLSVEAAGIPVASIQAYAGPEAPAGWLMCNGQTVSRTGYAALFAVIGTIHGAGDGSTTFALPDLRGRAVFGLDNMGNAADSGRLSYPNVIGGNGGSQRKTFNTDTTALTADQLPAHKHTLLGRHDAGNISNSKGLITSSSGVTLGTGTCVDLSDAVSNTGTGQGHSHAVTNVDMMPPYILLNYLIKC